MRHWPPGWLFGFVSQQTLLNPTCQHTKLLIKMEEIRPSLEDFWNNSLKCFAWKYLALPSFYKEVNGLWMYSPGFSFQHIPPAAATGLTWASQNMLPFSSFLQYLPSAFTQYPKSLFHPVNCGLCKLLEYKDHILITIYSLTWKHRDCNRVDTQELFVEWLSHWAVTCSTATPVWVRKEIMKAPPLPTFRGPDPTIAAFWWGRTDHLSSEQEKGDHELWLAVNMPQTLTAEQLLGSSQEIVFASYFAIDSLEVFVTLGLSHLNNCLQGPGECTNSTGYVSHAQGDTGPQKRLVSIVVRTGFLALLFESGKRMRIVSKLVRAILVFPNTIISSGFNNLWFFYLGHL